MAMTAKNIIFYKFFTPQNLENNRNSPLQRSPNSPLSLIRTYAIVCTPIEKCPQYNPPLPPLLSWTEGVSPLHLDFMHLKEEGCPHYTNLFLLQTTKQVIARAPDRFRNYLSALRDSAIVLFFFPGGLR